MTGDGRSEEEISSLGDRLYCDAKKRSVGGRRKIISLGRAISTIAELTVAQSLPTSCCISSMQAVHIRTLWAEACKYHFTAHAAFSSDYLSEQPKRGETDFRKAGLHFGLEFEARIGLASISLLSKIRSVNLASFQLGISYGVA